jgi:hypothetical protein
MSILKTITVDDFYSKQEAINISHVVWNLPFKEKEFGKEIENFNMIPGNANIMFSQVLNKQVEIIEEESGVFRIPHLFIHFEPCDSALEWLFVVALQESIFNIFEHKDGVKTALGGINHNYRNLFEWDLMVNYILKPGQGVFFRPWLFHSFNQGIIQKFRLKEINVS